MPNLLAMSFEGELAPSFDLQCLQPGRRLPDGWGIGFFPAGDASAVLLKEPAPATGSIRSELVKSWDSVASSTFLLHLRFAQWGNNSIANTQPFERSWKGRDWLFGHSGSLRRHVEFAQQGPFDPVGSTDSERIFCELLNRVAASECKSLGGIDAQQVRAWFVEINAHGSMTSVLTDGHDVIAYADKQGDGELWIGEVLPPHEDLIFGDADLQIDLTRRGIKARKGVIVCSTRLEARAEACGLRWRQVLPGTLLRIRQGAVMDEVRSLPAGKGSTPPRPIAVGAVHRALPAPAEPKRFRVRHRTEYHYEIPVERSTHMFRLRPVHDERQRVLHSELRVSVEGVRREFDDVFGNKAVRVALDSPYTSLIIEAESLLETLEVEPLRKQSLAAPTSLPHPWMPWQRHMLAPYLLSPELPESQLVELAEYATSFAIRNDYDLLDTLIDLNQSIFREYEYRQGSTTVYTTPFEVYAKRRGVCQDFTNLFICLARLLNIPARYTCGYIFTGSRSNQAQGEASHAWVQVFLPEHGWVGFDPTNGCITQTDHIRVSVGRNYVDATPTSGTLYVGGGREKLHVDVRVELVTP